MFLKQITKSSLVFVLSLVLFPCDSVAATVFLGPTPYLSATDSPFPVDGSNPNFFLEDFEDGSLNTPGVDADFVIRPPTNFITTPGPKTDSVDADDGTIDGTGVGGRSLRGLLAPDFLFDYQAVFSFNFSGQELGFLPNAFGIVWTDGPAPSEIGLFAFDALGNPLGLTTIPDGLPTSLGDMSDMGETAEDHFVGLRTTESFSRVIVSIYFDPQGPILIDPLPIAELDHLQYGLIVPEPHAILLALICLSMLLSISHRHVFFSIA